MCIGERRRNCQTVKYKINSDVFLEWCELINITKPFHLHQVQSDEEIIQDKEAPAVATAAIESSDEKDKTSDTLHTTPRSQAPPVPKLKTPLQPTKVTDFEGKEGMGSLFGPMLTGERPGFVAVERWCCTGY